MSYSVYTQAFDQEIEANQLLVPSFSDKIEHRFRKRKYNRATNGLFVDCASRAELFKSRLSEKSKTNPKDIAVSVLLDHSGSLRRNGGAESVLCIAQAISVFLCELRISHELLGFTTNTWHGGQSRKMWEISGSTPKPGRLCDLLHIVYRSFTDMEQQPPEALLNILNFGLLKENIDGEALQ